ncbi:MAG: TonB-dependent receptor [Proteobacteria bacterium]|nr:TonB-dependent receptor [Pseudomonadota bacterium]
MKTRTLHIAKLIVMVWGLSAAMVSAEDIESIEKQDNQLEDITVSATRAEKPLYKIPAAIGVVDKNDIGLGKQRIGLDESLVRIPGMFMQNRYNFAQSLKISIRGFGARANFGTRGIKLYQDGIPLTTVDGQGGIEDIDLNSINRIEVMRGPASSLYGSSSGGVIHFFTGDEDDVEPYVESNVSLGEYQSKIGNIKTGGQIDKLSYFLNLSHLDVTGYRSHSRARNTKFNSKFKYKIDDTADFTTIFTAYDAPQADDPGGINQQQVDDDRRSARDRNVAFNAGEDIDQQKLGFTYRKQITPNQELTLRNYYVMRNFVGLIPVAASGYIEFERFQFGGGAQYSILSDLFGHNNRTIIGFDVDSQEDDRQRYENNSGFQGAQVLNQLEQGDSLGIYIRNELALTDNFELSLGLRYDKVDLEVDDVFLGDGDQSAELNFEELSPMAGVSWAINPGTNIYANISSVFETPTFTELANVAAGGFANVSAQKAWNYEIGVKGYVNPRFNYALAVFHIDVEDEIINIVNIGGRSFFNNADTTRNGVEATVSFIPVAGVNMLMSYTFSDFTFDNFPASECDVSTCVGNDLPGLPEHNFYTELAYTHPSGFFSSIDFQYVSNMYVDNSNTAQNRPYGVSNLRAGYIKTMGDLEISPYMGINNLFDEEYIGNVRINAFGSRYFEPAPEFNVYAGLNVRYLY